MKDPAFLFYSSDFLTGTILMSNEQVGKYIKLMCLQHQIGHLKEEDLYQIIDKKDTKILSKLVKDNDGNYYNKRLELEIEKRSKHKEKQRENGLKGGRPKNPNKTQTKPKRKPLENENEIENINVIKNIIEYLNKKTNRNYSYKAEKNKTVIIARLNEGYTEEQFKMVIDKKSKQWLNTKFNEFLRPETLFSNKFDGYLNAEEITEEEKPKIFGKKIMSKPEWLGKEIKTVNSKENNQKLEEMLKAFK